MGDGRVALILDLPGLVRFAELENAGGEPLGKGLGRKTNGLVSSQNQLNS